MSVPRHTTTSAGEYSYSSLGVGLGISLYCTSKGSCLPPPAACPGSSECVTPAPHKGHFLRSCRPRPLLAQPSPPRPAPGRHQPPTSLRHRASASRPRLTACAHSGSKPCRPLLPWVPLSQSRSVSALGKAHPDVTSALRSSKPITECFCPE